VQCREAPDRFHPLAKNSRVAVTNAPEAALRGRKAGAVAPALQGAPSAFICGSSLRALRVLRGFIYSKTEITNVFASRVSPRRQANAPWLLCYGTVPANADVDTI